MVPAALLAAMLLGTAVPDRADAAPSAHWWQVGIAYPRLTGRVVDNAALLPGDSKARLTARLARYEATTGHQLVVVSVPSLGQRTIEDFCVGLGRSWGIGRRDYNDGVLLIMAPRERQVRIEVGYGLEKQLSDPDCARIIRTTLVPAFARGRFASGIEAGVNAIIATIDAHAATRLPRAGAPAKPGR